jgi:hypothetical protein
MLEKIKPALNELESLYESYAVQKKILRKKNSDKLKEFKNSPDILEKVRDIIENYDRSTFLGQLWISLFWSVGYYRELVQYYDLGVLIQKINQKINIDSSSSAGENKREERDHKDKRDKRDERSEEGKKSGKVEKSEENLALLDEMLTLLEKFDIRDTKINIEKSTEKSLQIKKGISKIQEDLLKIRAIFSKENAPFGSDSNQDMGIFSDFPMLAIEEKVSIPHPLRLSDEAPTDFQAVKAHNALIVNYMIGLLREIGKINWGLRRFEWVKNSSSRQKCREYFQF